MEELAEEEEVAMVAEAAYAPSCFQWKHCGAASAGLDGGWELNDPDDSD
ncbi:hypothetical protein N8602_00270 [bacterium]|nr:hypothetical protein [bacterium]